MAGQGAGIEALLSRMLSRERGRPVLKVYKPLRLKDGVASRKPEKQASPCITQLSVLMACWKETDFSNTLCSGEISALYQCIEKAEESREKAKQTFCKGGNLPPKEATNLLKRYPTMDKEI